MKKQKARRDVCHDAPASSGKYFGGVAMFGDTELPLALIMEEILGWEKKSGQDKDKDEKEKSDKQK